MEMMEISSVHWECKFYAFILTYPWAAAKNATTDPLAGIEPVALRKFMCIYTKVMPRSHGKVYG